MMILVIMYDQLERKPHDFKDKQEILKNLIVFLAFSADRQDQKTFLEYKKKLHLLIVNNQFRYRQLGITEESFQNLTITDLNDNQRLIIPDFKKLIDVRIWIKYTAHDIFSTLRFNAWCLGTDLPTYAFKFQTNHDIILSLRKYADFDNQLLKQLKEVLLSSTQERLFSKAFIKFFHRLNTYKNPESHELKKYLMLSMNRQDVQKFLRLQALESNRSIEAFIEDFCSLENAHGKPFRIGQKIYQSPLALREAFIDQKPLIVMLMNTGEFKFASKIITDLETQLNLFNEFDIEKFDFTEVEFLTLRYQTCCELGLVTFYHTPLHPQSLIKIQDFLNYYLEVLSIQDSLLILSYLRESIKALLSRNEKLDTIQILLNHSASILVNSFYDTNALSSVNFKTLMDYWMSLSCCFQYFNSPMQVRNILKKLGVALSCSQLFKTNFNYWQFCVKRYIKLLSGTELTLMQGEIKLTLLDEISTLYLNQCEQALRTRELNFATAMLSLLNLIRNEFSADQKSHFNEIFETIIKLRKMCTDLKALSLAVVFVRLGEDKKLYADIIFEDKKRTMMNLAYFRGLGLTTKCEAFQPARAFFSIPTGLACTLQLQEITDEQLELLSERAAEQRQQFKHKRTYSL